VKTIHITNQKFLRKLFWESHPDLATKAREAGVISRRQNFHCATTRAAFVDWVYQLERDGKITNEFASRVTL
jgi:hypothetical protein